jgi:hypothetical protein
MNLKSVLSTGLALLTLTPVAGAVDNAERSDRIPGVVRISTFYRDRGDAKWIECSGTIISRTTVLTSGSCVRRAVYADKWTDIESQIWLQTPYGWTTVAESNQVKALVSPYYRGQYYRGMMVNHNADKDVALLRVDTGLAGVTVAHRSRLFVGSQWRPNQLEVHGHGSFDNPVWGAHTANVFRVQSWSRAGLIKFVSDGYTAPHVCPQDSGGPGVVMTYRPYACEDEDAVAAVISEVYGYDEWNRCDTGTFDAASVRENYYFILSNTPGCRTIRSQCGADTIECW